MSAIDHVRITGSALGRWAIAQLQDSLAVGLFCPIDLIPSEMQELASKSLLDGRLYCLTFRKPRRTLSGGADVPAARVAGEDASATKSV